MGTFYLCFFIAEESEAQRLNNLPKTKQQVLETGFNVDCLYKFFMNHIKFLKNPHKMLAWLELSPKCIFIRECIAE